MAEITLLLVYLAYCLAFWAICIFGACLFCRLLEGIEKAMAIMRGDLD